MRFVKSKCKRVAIENPVGIMNTYYRKPDQVIQPWQFGHNESKRTCLWLKGLPALKCGDIMPPAGYQEVVYAGQLHPCECCGEPWCELHQEHYADCKCFGPTQDNLHYVKIEGFEFATDIQPPPKPLWGNQTSSGQNKLGQRPDRAMLRSKTYKGIAEAMAKQWGKLIPVGK